MRIILVVVSVCVIAISCSGRKTETVVVVTNNTEIIMLHQMYDDWHNNVPVTLSADGKSVSHFPTPVEVRKMKKPVKLRYAWWYDVRKLDKSTAFLDWTMEEYGKLKITPTAEEINKHILTRQPFVRLCNCGTDAGKELEEYMKRVNGDEVSGCKWIIKP